MNIVISQWALDAYLDLKSRQIFSPQEYWGTIRPDALLLRQYPLAPKFKNGMASNR